MVAILRKEIARQYLLSVTPKTEANVPPDPRELILSSYLPEKEVLIMDKPTAQRLVRSTLSAI